MPRLTDWRARLTEYLLACARTPFAFGRHDCALFAAGAVDAMTGTDPAAAWRGRYRTLSGGLRLMRKAGHADHIAATAAGFKEVHPAMAGEGDLAAVETEEGLALGVLCGEVVYVASPNGTAILPRTVAVRGWVV